MLMVMGYLQLPTPYINKIAEVLLSQMLMKAKHYARKYHTIVILYYFQVFLMLRMQLYVKNIHLPLLSHDLNNSLYFSLRDLQANYGLKWIQACLALVPHRYKASSRVCHLPCSWQVLCLTLLVLMNLSTSLINNKSTSSKPFNKAHKPLHTVYSIVLV